MVISQTALRSSSRISQQSQIRSKTIQKKAEEKEKLEQLQRVASKYQEGSLPATPTQTTGGFTERDWGLAIKSAFTGKGQPESRWTANAQRIYNYILDKERVDNSTLSGAEKNYIKKLQYQLQSKYSSPKVPTQSEILKNLYSAQVGEIKVPKAGNLEQQQTSSPQISTSTQFSSANPFTTSTTNFYSALNQQKKLNNEIVRYQNLGYVGKEAESLAKASLSRGGMTFSPEESQKIIKKNLTPIEITNIKDYKLKQYETQTPYFKLYKEGRFPSIIRKGARDIGEAFLSKYGQPEELTPEQRKKYGSILGETALFYAFSPTFSTGTASIQEQISKSKFDKLGEALKNLEKNLVEKENAVEQTKYLNEIAKQLKTTAQKDNFKKWVISQYEKGNFKGIPLETIKQKSAEELTILVPQLKQAKNILAVSNLFYTPTIEKTKTQEISVNNEMKTSDIGKANIFSGIRTLTNTKTPQVFKYFSEEKTTTATKTIPKEVPKIRTLLALDPLLKQKVINIFKKPSPTKIKTPSKKIPMLKKIIFLKSFKSSKSSSSFSVFGRRFGKDILLKKTKSKKEAERVLSKFLTGTLGRSGQIFEEGKALEFKNINLGVSSQFRPSKKSSKRVVQKARFSLGTGQEVSEIQFFRKRKGKKNLLNI